MKWRSYKLLRHEKVKGESEKAKCDKNASCEEMKFDWWSLKLLRSKKESRKKGRKEKVKREEMKM